MLSWPFDRWAELASDRAGQPRVEADALYRRAALGVGSAVVTALAGLPQQVPYTSAFVFLLAAIAFSRFNWRCPVCGAHLVGNDPASCHHCHVALR